MDLLLENRSRQSAMIGETPPLHPRRTSVARVVGGQFETSPSVALHLALAVPVVVLELVPVL